MSSMRYFIPSLLLCLCTHMAGAQNIIIKGRAHASHIGKEIVLWDYTDYITYTKTRESADTVDKNGYFELRFQSKLTKPLMISVDNVMGKLYVQPDFNYGIYFPERDSSLDRRGDVEDPVNISVYAKDSTELNSRIIDFNSLYNAQFDMASGQYLSPAMIYKKLDTLNVLAKRRYKTLDKNYFGNYIEYSIATMNSDAARSKNYLVARYITHKPIQYDNYEYMEFFNSVFKDYLKGFASMHQGGNIYNSINKFASYKDLDLQFREDKLVKGDSLRELVLLKSLYEFYYSPDFNPHNVLSMIEQCLRDTRIERHKQIAQQMLQTMYKLQPGAAAPIFDADDRTGNSVSLMSYRKSFVYLNFFSVKSETSLREMGKIADLKKKYSDKVVFISICVDDSIRDYKEYLRLNPKYDWLILFNNNTYKDQSAKALYNIKGVPAFFFINPQGQLVQSPAPAPSEGIEYKFKALFRPQKGNRIIGIR